jgi:C1A family cysteine protease
MLLSATSIVGELPELNPSTHTNILAAATVQSSGSGESAVMATGLSLPSSYDLRAYGDVSSVKNQGGYGTCWAFATYASLESSLLKASDTWSDFSERNLAYQSGFDWGYSDGGNSYLSEAYFGRFSGPISESDDPYSSMGTADNVTGPAQYYVREMLRFDSQSELKTSLMTYGAAYTFMYWDSDYFRSSDCTYYYNGSGSNHAVAIVGWDDSKATAGGTGAWLVKNSWGEGWANGGYFWLAYQDTSGGQWGEVFCDAVPATTYSKAYYYDTFGDVGEINTPYAFNKYIATSTSQLTSVGFFTEADGASYTINVYDTFSGGTLSNLMTSVSGTQTYAGYHTVDLASAVSLYEGNDFYVSLHITNGGTYCMAVDYRWAGYNSASSALADQSYYSYNGTSWNDLTTWESTANFCIKALVQESEPTPDSLTNSFYGDFNGDGTDDTLRQNQDTGLVGAWITNNGVYTRWTSMGTPSLTEWQLVGTGDFNGDGTSDVLWRNKSTGLVGAWIIRNGVYTDWAGMGTASLAEWQVAGTGDFNGDDTSDVLWRNKSTGLVGAWIIRNGVYTDWAGMAAPSLTEWRVAGTGDFNGDGTSDVLWRNKSTGLVGAWIIRNGVYTDWAGMGTASLTEWQIVGTGDFNGNGTDDILWQNQSTGLVGAWIIQNGVYTSWSSMGPQSLTEWQVAGTGDFNGDGTSDILWRNQSTGLVGEWIIQNSMCAGWTSMGTPGLTEWQIVGTGDYNGDGTDDTLWQNQDTGLVGAWIINNGVCTRWTSVGTASLTEWQVVGSGDFNGDGTSDILWRNKSTGLVGAWIIQDGTYTAWAGMVAPSLTEWQVAGTGDFNGDGTSDVLWRNKMTGLVGAWIIRNGVYTEWAGMGTASLTEWQVAGTGDFNGNGNDDILWRNKSTGLVGAWIIQNGVYTDWAGMAAPSLTEWQIVGIGDYNGAGTDDILWQNQSTGLLGTWIIQNGRYTDWVSMGTPSLTESYVAGGSSTSQSSVSGVATFVETATNVNSLAEADPKAIVARTMARGADIGLNDALMATLTRIESAIDDLSGSLRSTAVEDRQTVDINAIGNSYSVDPSPLADEEYMVTSSRSLQAIDSRAVDRIDLFAVVECQLGHLLSLDNIETPNDDPIWGLVPVLL